jgi:DHA3 family macrolide efflux protein-like MFS transporter
MGAHRQQDSWQVPFFAIWSGQAVSLVGSKVAQFALVWWLTELTGSATVLATASLVALLPEIILGPVAGAYVDRWRRRTILIVSDGLVAMAALWLACLFLTGSIQIWHIYAVMLVRSVSGSFQWPAMQASTSLMVPKKHLTRVAGLNQTMSGALNIVGPPLGALLMAVVPLHGIMLVDVVTALLAVGPLLFFPIPQPRRSDLGQDEGQRPSVWTDVRSGLRYVRAWPGLMALIGAALIVKFALTPAFSLLPLLVSKHFGGDAAQLSLLEAVAGVGITAGGLILTAWGGFRRRIYTTMMGMVILGLGFVGLGLTPEYRFWLALSSVLVVGLTIPLIDGPIMAILQGTVVPEMQGRVFTIVGALLGLTSPLGLAVAGPVSDWLGLQVWYLAAGVLCSLIGLSGFVIPVMARIEENHNGGAVSGEVLAPVVTRVPARGA